MTGRAAHLLYNACRNVLAFLTARVTQGRLFAILFFACTLTAFADSKHVEIDKTHQMLRAYEGTRLVFRSRVSTGKRGSTPSGRFYVHGKERMHYSRRYDNAPMPYSVHLRGHYFIHGYSYVPYYPASHGCIRLPLNRGNPARRFYEWVDIGTPVVIRGEWR